MRMIIRATVVISLICFVSSIHGSTRPRKTFDFELSPLLQPQSESSSIPEELVYEQLLRMVLSFSKEADKQAVQGHPERAEFLRKYFETRTGLSADDIRALKTVAQEVLSPTGCRPSKSSANPQPTKQYKSRLVQRLGIGRVELLDRYVRENLIPRVSYSEVGDAQRPMFGFSQIDYVYNSDEVVGYSYTNESGGFCQVAVNQVTASLVSDDLGLLASDSAETCDEIAEVFLYWENPNPGDRLCMEAEHAYAITWVQMRPNTVDIFGSKTPKPNGGWYCEYQGLYNLPPSDDCWTAPTNGIQGVNFQLIATDSPAIETNPNMGAGLRVFPDKNSPGDTVDRQTIRVTATSSNELPGRPVYFRAFDLDDPETNTVIDTNGTTGNDNNGSVTGGTSAGRLSAVSATPNSSGVATVNFTVTMQPGDNFAVAASTNESLLTNATIDGINLRTASGTLIESSCDGTSTICRSEMLTVWRRLHLEVDSMGSASQNAAAGYLFEGRVLTGQRTIPLSVTNLERNRFENGRMVITDSGTVRSLRVVDAVYDMNNGMELQNANTADSVTIFNDQGRFTVSEGATFMLYDDDDMDDDDPNLNGDNGDNVLPPDTGIMQDSDVECAATVGTNNCNVFVNAYVRPTYDLAGEDVGSFNSNMDDLLFTAYRNSYFQNTATEANDLFWTVYLLSSYQFREFEDSDPTEEGAVLGTVDTLNGSGATVFSEVIRGIENEFLPNWQNRPVGRRFVTAHEIGHLFFGLHADGGLMSQTTTRQSPLFDASTLNKIRGGEFFDPISLTTRRITHP